MYRVKFIFLPVFEDLFYCPLPSGFADEKSDIGVIHVSL